MNIISIAKRQLGMLLILLSVTPVFSQQITQVIRGKIVDAESQSPLAGASITVMDTAPLLGSVSSDDGNFRIANIPLGRQTLFVSLAGYEPVSVPEILVTSSKELILFIELKQSVRSLDEIVIKAGLQKHKPLNMMATVSARSFSVEETRRYAGGLDDPARMASAFAGVTPGNMQDNAIIIRGNAPKGVLWRLEGIEIPNPNHFAGGNVAGGGVVTIFSSQMLAHSDFLTGAFPAEYGNAMAGVFDMKLRNGNNEQRESSVQVGLLGIDLSSEGPFKKGKQAAYLFNYRYSTLSLLAGLGLFNQSQVPAFQDFSFKLNFPTQKAGTLSVWGIGAMDHALEKESTDSARWETNWDRVRNDWRLSMGAMGISHKILLGSGTYLNTTLAASGVSNVADIQRVDDQLTLQPDAKISDQSWRATLSSVLNHKFNASFSLRTGVNYHRLFYNLDVNSTVNNIPGTFRNITSSNGETGFAEYFMQTRYHINPAISINAGINVSYYDMNHAFSIDPRLGIQYKLTSRHIVGLGYGRHRQMEDLRIYMVEKKINNQTYYPNKNLDIARAHHFIFSYDWLISSSLRLKIEPYYQLLQKVPGIADSSYSMINFRQDWTFSDSLGNNSRGRNVGIDFTLERFLQKNYYFLITGSLFDSKYKAPDGRWRNTRYNKSYAINLLGGKEFITQKGHVWGVNLRFNYIGGERYSPVDKEKTLAEKKIYYDERKAFEKQAGPMYYFDATITYRVNRKNYSGALALQLKNALGSPAFYGYDYYYRTGEIVKEEDRIMLPVLSYKIEF
ncbi:MAG: TonB-dependent receptor [Chitinophagaceae bacterium]|nr:TonB-dependent receptor [Chitinophagaceae bacterium]